MPTLLDSLGNWVGLGTITPTWEWQRYQDSDTSNSSLFRITYQSNYPAFSQGYYFRVLIGDSPLIFSNTWLSLYSKLETDYLELPVPLIFARTSIIRRFEIKLKSPQTSNINKYNTCKVKLDKFVFDEQTVFEKVSELELEVLKLKQQLTTVIGLLA